MEIPPSQSPTPSLMEVILYLIIFVSVGVFIGASLIYLIQRQKEITIMEYVDDPTARYLNPIDKDPIGYSLRFKVPDPDDTIQVFTGNEEDSPIDGFIRKRKRPVPVSKCKCGMYDCKGNCTSCPEGCNCTASKGTSNEVH